MHCSSHGGLLLTPSARPAGHGAAGHHVCRRLSLVSEQQRPSVPVPVPVQRGCQSPAGQGSLQGHHLRQRQRLNVPPAVFHTQSGSAEFSGTHSGREITTQLPCLRCCETTSVINRALCRVLVAHVMVLTAFDLLFMQCNCFYTP